MGLEDVARMSLPAVRLLLRRQEARDAEAGLMALRVSTVGARGDGKAMRDLCNDLMKQAGMTSVADTPFKRLVAMAKRGKRKNKSSGRGRETKIIQ
jgi:hypothetical protein